MTCKNPSLLAWPSRSVCNAHTNKISATRSYITYTILRRKSGVLSIGAQVPVDLLLVGYCPYQVIILKCMVLSGFVSQVTSSE